jgi:hypothetical protein
MESTVKELAASREPFAPARFSADLDTIPRPLGEAVWTGSPSMTMLVGMVCFRHWQEKDIRLGL